MPTTTPFQNLITFSRGSNATVTGPDGLIQWAPHNLLTFSESFDNAAWMKTGATVFANQDFGNGTLGPELVTNGDFASATGWNTGGGWAISGGAASLTASTAILSQATTTGVAGRWYQVTFTVVSLTSGTLRVEFGGANGATRSAAGTYTEYLRATSTGLLLIQPLSALTATIDNISIKEITPAAAIAPDGTWTADTIVTSGTAAAQRLGQNAVTTGQVTFSTYVKAGTAQFVQLLHGSDVNAFANFDVATGTLGTRGTGASSAIVAVGNGWYRCSLTFNIASNSAWYVYIAPSASATYGQVFTATVAGLLIWGAQLELGSTATTYNPTTVKNLLGFSEAFDNAAWTKSRASIVTGAQANPINGLFNAQKLMENTENNYHYLVRGSLGVTAGTYTLSIYAKAAERSRILLYFGPTNKGRAFDLAAGTTYQQSGVPDPDAYSIVSLGGGWYRCSITVNSATPTTAEIYLVSGAAFSYTGDGSSGVYIYGAQLSDSASLDPYVPTPGAAPSSTAYYGPRFDYDPVTRQPKGILIEEARTNLLLRSEEFDNASWNKYATTATANTTESPDGTADADSITATGGIAQHYLNQSFSFTSGTAYTLSVFAKKGALNGVQLTFGSGAFSTLPYANFDLNAGTSFASNCTAAISDFGDGWYRCTITATADGTVSAALVIALARSLAEVRLDNFSSDGNGIFIWGAQLEAGAFATSYIPTIASTVTRSADVATITGSLFSQWYRQDQGVFVFVGDAVNIATNNPAYDVSDGTNNNRIAVGPDFSGVQAVVRAGGATVASLPRSDGLLAGSVFRHSLAYAVDNFAAVLNGGSVLADTSGAVPVGVSQVGLGGNNPLGTNKINGHIRSISFIPFRSADFQLQNVTRQPPWNVLAANGTLYNIGVYSARTADGTAYAVPQTVLSSTGISYNVI